MSESNSGGLLHCCAGQTAADVAAKSGHSRLADYLRKLAAGKSLLPSPKTLPASLQRQLTAALNQYSELLKAQVMATQTGSETTAVAEAVAALGPLNMTGTRAKPVTAVSMTGRAAEAASRVHGDLAPEAVAAAAVAAARRLAESAGKRGWEGVGTQGTELASGVKGFRVLATLTQVGP